MLEIPYEPRGRNEADRGLTMIARYHKREAELELCGHFLKSAARMADLPPTRARRRVTIHQYRWALLDKDNFHASHKELLDALKRLGLLVDDSEKWVEHGEHSQVIDRRSRRTEIIVEET